MLDRPSPNFGPRRNGLKPTLIVIHYTAMASAEDAVTRLCDPASEVSAHYLIDRAGVAFRMVDEAERAWHAGAGEWRGQSDINSRSIGIELDNDGDSPFAAPLMNTLEGLLHQIANRWSIAPHGVIGHEDMAPGRKVDPGRRFDWARLQRLGLVAAPDMSPVDALYQNSFKDEDCADLLHQIGYTADASVTSKLQAFRNRFLPRSHGAPNGADRAMMLQYLNDYGSSSLC